MLLGTSSVVVIGAGVRGVAIAYHLARAGVAVTVVDRAFAGSGASGASFALISVAGMLPAHYTALCLMSADMFPGLDEELGCDLEYERGNQIFRVFLDEAELPAAREVAAAESSVPGVEVTLLSAAEIREFEPNVSPLVAGGLLCHQDGHVNPFKLTYGFLSAAQRLGARFLPNHRVIGLRTHGDRVQGVVTEHGEISCDVVVNAAGIDVPTIGRMVNVEIPMSPCRGQVVTTEPVPGLIRQPLGLMKPNRSGPILIGSTYDYVGFRSQVDLQTVAGVARRASAIVPALRDVKVLRVWAGLRPMPADGLPIIGRVPGIEGLLLATGHSGYTLAQITARAITEIITAGETSLSLDGFTLDRFNLVAGAGYSTRN